MFYRFKNNEWVNWRLISYHVTIKLIRKSVSNSIGNPTGCKCLIVDDTDMPKTGWRIELVGRIWSHVSNSSKLGFKGLFLGTMMVKVFMDLIFLFMEKKERMKRSLLDSVKNK